MKSSREYLNLNAPQRAAVAYPVARWRRTRASNKTATVFRKPTFIPKFVIEKENPGVGKLSAKDHRECAQQSRSFLRGMGAEVQWVQSYVTGDKIYCVHVAPSRAPVREHASKGGFPANKISRVVTTMDPTTAE